MEPKKRMKSSLPPYYLAVHWVGFAALAVGSISVLPKFRPIAVAITPRLGITWIAWTIMGLGIFAVFINGARLIAHTRRIKRCA